MAYKQKPGRGSMPKTGRSIPPVLMSGCKSPMKQQDSPEYTSKHSRLVNEFNENISTPEGRAKIEKGNQMSIDSKSGVAVPNIATHTTQKVGNFMEERDSKGGFVRRIQMNRLSPGGGEEAEALVRKVERANNIKAAQAERNVRFTNLGSSRATPTTPKELQSMRDRGRITNR
jgi:hypothetical protein